MDESEPLYALLIEAAGTRSTAEVARLLGCTERSIRFYYSGKIPKVATMERLYSALMLPQAMVKRLVRAHTSAVVKARQERAGRRATRGVA